MVNIKAISATDETAAADEPVVLETKAAEAEPKAISEPPAPPPAPPPKQAEAPTFDVVLERPTQRAAFGWTLDMLSAKALHIEALAGDPAAAVARYNAGAPAGLDIRAGDFITKVNGVSDTAKSLGDTLAKQTKATVTIQRPETYIVEMNQVNKALGVDLNYTTNGKMLHIGGISDDGAMKEKAPQVSIGDWIATVNGQTMAPKELVAALKGGPSLQLEMVKAPKV